MTTQQRNLCTTCMQPNLCCYCGQIKKFDSRIHFVILIHPIEFRRRIATGRMSHLSLDNSYLIRGHDFSKHSLVNELIADPSRHCVILYPGANSVDVSLLSGSELMALVPTDKILTIFVLDGTWMTAKKMIKVSENLKSLPRISFTPSVPSNFRVRKQPHAKCYSTIEAIHQTIEILGPSQGFQLESRQHDHLLLAFDSLVEQQIRFIEEFRTEHQFTRYRRERETS